MTTLAIRPYEDADHAAVRNLFIRVNRELAPAALRERFEDYIASSLASEIDRIPSYYDAARSCGFWVALWEGALVGNFGLEPAENDTALELRRMYVDPQARRLGIARIMLDKAEAICRERGRLKMVLSTSELQPAAVGLYRAAGYRLVRQEIAAHASNKTIGGGIVRFHLEKWL
jgi:GNAT superfamily N-acetyltransferase